MCENRTNDETKIYKTCSNENNKDQNFYSNYRGSLSTLNPNLNEFYKKHYGKWYVDKNHTDKVQNFINGPIKVETKKLDTIIDEHKDFINKRIDLISIDVDGSEEMVFGGFDINKLIAFLNRYHIGGFYSEKCCRKLYER